MPFPSLNKEGSPTWATFHLHPGYPSPGGPSVHDAVPTTPPGSTPSSGPHPARQACCPLTPASYHKPSSAKHAHGSRQCPQPWSDWLAPFPQPQALGAPVWPPTQQGGGYSERQTGIPGRGGPQAAQPSWASVLIPPRGKPTSRGYSQDSVTSRGTHGSTGPQRASEHHCRSCSDARSSETLRIQPPPHSTYPRAHPRENTGETLC